ncbi:MAG: hypothetical protein HYT44_03800 [Nitrosarchaeum sp.]|nr:hypothetical protein [Nitrosarchaeum sp.]
MATLKDYFGCVLLVIIGLVAIYIWESFFHEWIVLVIGIVLIIFGIIAGIKIK